MAIKRADRARQFMPFAALTGYYEIIKERERVAVPRRELSEEELQILSDKMNKVKKGDMVTVTHYIEYRYEETTGLVSNIDTVYRTISIVKNKIPFDDIVDLQFNKDK